LQTKKHLQDTVTTSVNRITADKGSENFFRDLDLDTEPEVMDPELYFTKIEYLQIPVRESPELVFTVRFIFDYLLDF
jgi:hypothetical protein